MITTQRYFIHVDNKSVVPWTSEVEGNYKFKEITVKVAMAIENGKISADEVVEQVMKQIKPATLEQMLDAKLRMNVREGELNLESQIREDNTQHDTGEAKPFEVNIPDDNGGEQAAGDAPSGEQAAGDTPSGEQAVGDTPAKDGTKKPAGKPAGKSAGKPAGRSAKDKQSAPQAEAPVGDAPAGDAPGAEAPADDAAKVAAALDGNGEQAAGGVNV